MDAPSPHRPPLAFEDFSPGMGGTADLPVVTRDAIVAFAGEYDPQSFHLDEEAATHSFVGELIASGWHSCALLMRAIADGLLLRSTCMGAPGVDEVRWLRPVRPGDALRLRWTVGEAKASRSRPEMGLVRFRFEMLRGDEPVLTQSNWIMFGRRLSAVPDGTGPAEEPSAAAIAAAPPPIPGERGPPSPFFDDLEVGASFDLGTYAFTAEAIVGFATEFDPQPFHLDPEAARRSHFGGLCASGWHTAAAWMKRWVEHRRAGDERARQAGQRPAMLGTSPGFRDLRWIKPVYAGDVVRYRSTVLEKRPGALRRGWGLVAQHNTGENQRGERVFEFRGSVFWEKR